MAQVGHSSSTISLPSNNSNGSSKNSVNSTDNSAVGATNSSGSTVKNDGKALNGKDFSEIMESQSGAEKSATSEAKSGASRTAEGSGESTEEALGEGLVVLLQTPLEGLTTTGTGKELPVEGSPLPLLGIPAESGNVSASPSNTIIAASVIEPLVATPGAEQVLTPAQSSLPGVAALAGAPEQQQRGTIAVTASGSAPITVVATNSAAEAAVLPAPGSAAPVSAVPVSISPHSAALSGADAAANPVATMASMQTLGSGGLVGQDSRGRWFDDSAVSNTAVLATTKLSSGEAGASSNAQAIAQPLSLNAGGQMQMMTAVETLAVLTAAVPSEAIATVAATGSGVTTVPSLVVAESQSGYRQLATSTFQTAVPIEVGKPGWSDGVMQKVMWMSSQQINRAEIALDPPELGPLQVRVATQGDQTTVTFTSAHGSVRDALDQGVSRLREMMENQGLNLADVDVSDQRSSSRGDQNGQSQEDEADQEGGGVGGESSPTVDGATANGATTVGVSLVDSYV